MKLTRGHPTLLGCVEMIETATVILSLLSAVSFVAHVIDAYGVPWKPATWRTVEHVKLW